MNQWLVLIGNLMNIPQAPPKIYKLKPTTKVCRRCKVTYDLSGFYGRTAVCKECQKLYVKEWKRRNRTWG